MAIKYNNVSPTAGKYGNSDITQIKHTNGVTYKFVDAIAINSSVDQQIRNEDGRYAENGVTIFNGGRVNNYYDHDDEDDNDFYVITSGLPDNGTIWTTPAAGILQNAKLTIYMWVIGQLSIPDLNDDHFSISQRVIKLSTGQILVNRSDRKGPAGDYLQTPYSETHNLGDLTLSNNARIYLDTLHVYNWQYDCIGHIRYTITGTLSVCTSPLFLSI